MCNNKKKQMITKCPTNLKYFIDDVEVKRSLSGQIKQYVSNRPYFSQDINLLEGTNANHDGYQVYDFLDSKTTQKLLESLLNFLSYKFDIEINEKNYNSIFINMSNNIFHKKMNEIYKGISFSYLPFSLKFVEDWASQILGKDLKLFYINEPSLLLRIVRPFSIDFNPPHRDIYINRLRNAVNCFLPILGVNKNSSLPILPQSHFWPESTTVRTHLNPIVDGIRFSVPSILYKSDLSPLVLKRPEVKYGQAMLFSPYCIHGGGKNISSDTRISFELRFKIK